MISGGRKYRSYLVALTSSGKLRSAVDGATVASQAGRLIDDRYQHQRRSLDGPRRSQLRHESITVCDYGGDGADTAGILPHSNATRACYWDGSTARTYV